MALTADEIEILIKANTSGLETSLKNVEKQLGTFQKSFGGVSKGVSAGVVALGTVIGNIFSKIGSVISDNMDKAVSRVDTLNNFSKVMGNLGIDSNDATTSINILSEKLLGLPTSLDSAALAVQRFTSANGNIKASTDMFLALNNAILAGGASTELQANALEQMMQAYAKGKPDAIEWRAFLNAMPAQMKQVAQAMGYSSTAIGGDFQKALVEGRISMDDFMATVMKLNKEGVNGFANFEEQARTATGGIRTAIANLKISIQRAVANIMNTIGQLNIAGFINNIASFIGTIGNYVAAFVKIIKEAVAWLSVLFGGKGSTKDLVKSTSSVDSNLQGASSGAGATAKNLDDATGSAKKLAKQLASFDEMNVLQEPTQSGSESSGAGGGGVGGDFSDYDWDASWITNGTDKVEKAFQDLKKIFDDVFGDIDLDKIGKAFLQFKSDVEKALKPVGKILKDVWEDYLKPFVTWAGNDLLPAFLNAVGGAVNFLGTAIGTFWDKALKPFIDAFLVPIAKWTGGVITSVLNGIGDALRNIASNQGAIDWLVSTLKILLETFAAYKAINMFSTATEGLRAVLGGLVAYIGSTQTQMSALAFQLGSSTDSINLMSSAVGASTLGLSGLKTGIATMLTSLGELTLILGPIILLFADMQLWTEKNKLSEMEAAQAAAEYDAKIFSQEETMQTLNTAVQSQIDLKNELLGIEKNLADQSLALMDAQDRLATSQANADAIAAKYGMTTDEAREMVDKLDISSGNLTDKEKELAEAILDLESKEGTLRDAQDKVTESKGKQTEKSEELKNAALLEWKMAKQQELQSLINAGRFDEVADALENLTEETVTYTDENGRQCKIAGQDIKDSVDVIGDNLGRMDSDQSRAWKNAWHAADDSTEKIKGALRGLGSEAEANGKAIPDGVSRGVQNNQGGVLGVIGGFANSISNTFKKILGIASPSKVFAEAGKWIDLGLAKGIENNEGAVENATRSLSDAVMDNLSPLSEDFSLALPDVNAGSISRSLESDINLSDINSKPIQLLLKIDGESIPVSASRIADALNEESFLLNRNVVNI